MKFTINIIFQVSLFYFIIHFPKSQSSNINTLIKINKSNNLLQKETNLLRITQSQTIGSTGGTAGSTTTTNTSTTTQAQLLTNAKSAILNMCDSQTCPTQFGTCQSTTTCVCKDDFLNISWTGKQYTCDYAQKKQITAFMLEFFVIGIGHIYTGNFVLGSLKLVSIVIFPYLLLCFNFAGIMAEATVKTQTCFLWTTVVMFVTYFLGAVIWWLYDLIKFGTNNFVDSYGYPLKPW